MGSNPGSGRKSTTAPLLGSHSRLPTAPSALGWVKCREHISLLIILCIIVYVTNKAHLSLICIFVLFVPRHPGQIRPLASDHYDLLIIPIHWFAASICLLSTNKLVCGGCSGVLWLPSHHPGGCCTLVVDEEIPPLLCKVLWVPRKVLYKCN